MDMHVYFKSAAEDVLAEVPLGTGLLESLGHDLSSLRKLATDVDVGEMDIERVGGDGHPLDELMGIIVQDVTILERARLGFVTVADKVMWFAIIALDEAPFHTAGETGTTPSTKIRFFDLIDNLLGLHAEGLFQFGVAAMFFITLDVGRVSLCPGVLKDNAAFLGVWWKKKGFHEAY